VTGRSNALEAIRASGVSFLRLQFTDILGGLKSVAVPVERAAAALDGEVTFDGSAVEGFVRVEESDMRLVPDLGTFGVFPWEGPEGQSTGYLMCDVYLPDGRPFPGCPRQALRRQVEAARALGYRAQVGPEAEFFLFRRDRRGHATTESGDGGLYFDFGAGETGDDARRDMVFALRRMGFPIEAAHHENSPGQHEIDFRHADVLTTADRIALFRLVVRRVARQHGLHATFMPKPVYGQSGSGMHLHLSLFAAGGNVFYDPQVSAGLSMVGLQFLAGLLEHARACTAVTCSTVNSYKRLVPGYEAPVYVAWSERNRSPLIRVPAAREQATRIEFRSPDPAGNPYLCLAVVLAAGLDGLARGLSPPPPVNRNVYRLSSDERARRGIRQLPSDLGEALAELAASPLMRDTLGDHIYRRFLEAKRIEWELYRSAVHDWELEHYLTRL
jgi:glutamine synthetase